MALAHTLTVTDWSAASTSFSGWGAGRSVVDGALRIEAAATYPSIRAVSTYDLTGSSVTVELLEHPSTASNATEFYLGLEFDGSNRLQLGWTNNTLSARYTVAGANTTGGWTGYSTLWHRFLRIREGGGNIHWEVSPDGFTWTSMRDPLPLPFPVTNLTPTLMAGNYASVADPGAAVIGRFNLTDTTWGPNRSVDFGVFTASSPPTGPETDAVAGDAGRRPNLAAWYAIWPGTTLSLANLKAVDALGSVNYITWEAFKVGTPGAAEDAVYSYANILAGAHNAVIDAAAATCRAFGKTVYLRPFHEMNGNWYPWSVGVHGNTAAQHVQAWNYLRARFTAAGATNVRWVWSPNVSYNGSTPIAAVFPGSSNVDVVALDGYNWGAVAGESTLWEPPRVLFTPTLEEIRAVSTAPLWIGETACAEQGGDKPTWVRAFFAWLSHQPDVEAFSWFHLLKERDWRVHSTTAAKVAFQTEVAKTAAHPVVPAWRPVSLGSSAVTQTGGPPVALTGGTFTPPASMHPVQLRFTVGGDRTVVTVQGSRTAVVRSGGALAPARIRWWDTAGSTPAPTPGDAPVGVAAQAAVRSVTTAQLSSGTGVRTVDLPAGTRPGDLLLVVASQDAGSGEMSVSYLPSGFVELGRHPVPSAGTDLRMLLGYRVATGTEPAQLTFGFPTSADARVDVIAVRDADTTRPPTFAFHTTSASLTLHGIVGVTAGTDRSLVLRAMSKDDDDTAQSWNWSAILSSNGIRELTDAHTNGWLTQAVYTERIEGTTTVPTRGFSVAQTGTGVASPAVTATVAVASANVAATVPTYTPAPTNGTGGSHTDASAVAFTAGGVTSRYHRWAHGVDPAVPAPLVVHLHGDGAYEYDNPQTWTTPGYVAAGRAAGAIVVVPNTPDPGTTTDGVLVEGSRTWWEDWSSTTWLVALIRELYAKYNIDRRRVYLSGFSGGAVVSTMNLLADFAGEFTGGGAMLLGGGGPYETASTPPSAATRADFLLRWHVGELDDGRNTLDDYNARAAATSGEAAYRGAGWNTRLSLIPGVDHNASEPFGPRMLQQLLLESSAHYGL